MIKCVRARRFVLGCRFKSQIFPCFIFIFCSSFYYIFVNKKNLFVDLTCRTMLVRSAGSTLASKFFLSWTDFFVIDWNDLLQIVALVRHQAVWDDHRFRKGWKRTCMPRERILLLRMRLTILIRIKWPE